MEKYLFTDGTGGVKEVQSKEELDGLVRSAPKPELIRIWVFNTQEWIGFADFNQPVSVKNRKEIPVAKNTAPASRSRNGKQWLKKFLAFSITGSAIILVYNFTRIEWKKALPVHIYAVRPENVPLIDNDSLVNSIELTRGQKLDRTTKTNLRIRNDWPNRILLQLKSERDTSSAGTRFYQTEVIIDNTTGYMIDQAIVKFTVWKNGRSQQSDTLQFKNVSYALAAQRQLNGIFKGDSLSVSFQSIKAKSFNFCYSLDKKSNYGSVSDKWYCRE